MGQRRHGRRTRPFGRRVDLLGGHGPADGRRLRQAPAHHGGGRLRALRPGQGGLLHDPKRAAQLQPGHWGASGADGCGRAPGGHRHRRRRVAGRRRPGGGGSHSGAGRQGAPLLPRPKERLAAPVQARLGRGPGAVVRRGRRPLPRRDGKPQLSRWHRRPDPCHLCEGPARPRGCRPGIRGRGKDRRLHRSRGPGGVRRDGRGAPGVLRREPAGIHQRRDQPAPGSGPPWRRSTCSQYPAGPGGSSV